MFAFAPEALIGFIITSCFTVDLANAFQSSAAAVWTSRPFIPNACTALNLRSLPGVQLPLLNVSFPPDLKIICVK